MIKAGSDQSQWLESSSGSPTLWKGPSTWPFYIKQAWFLGGLYMSVIYTSDLHEDNEYGSQEAQKVII